MSTKYFHRCMQCGARWTHDGCTNWIFKLSYCPACNREAWCRDEASELTWKQVEDPFVEWVKGVRDDV